MSGDEDVEPGDGSDSDRLGTGAEGKDHDSNSERTVSADVPRFFEQLVRNTADAVLFADRSGTIQFWNESAARVFGYDRDEAIGRSLDLIVPEQYRDAHWAGYQRTMDAGESPYDPGELLSVPAVRDGGDRVYIELSITDIRDEDGRLAGLAAVVRDVTDRDEHR